MAHLKLTNSNNLVLIDDADFTALSKHPWYSDKWGYARSFIEGKPELLHRFIVKPDKVLWVDHINQNKLDNRRSNLRIVTRYQNQWNRPKLATHGGPFVSIYKGVRFNGVSWVARIRKNHIRYHLGSFPTERSAAMAYDIWAKELFGEYAYFNFQPV